MSSAPLRPAQGAALQREILRFIRRYAAGPAPELAFNSLALRIFQYQFKNNTLYRRYCEMEGATPVSVRDWKQIPAMPAIGFKELVLASFPRSRRVKVFRTSGTTGDRGAHYFETLELYEASILPGFQKHVLDKQKFSFHFLIAPPREAPDSSLSYMMGVVNRCFARGRGRFYVRDENLSCRTLERDLRQAKDRSLILATAFSLKAFIEHLEKMGKPIRLKKGSRIMETGGFKGRSREIPKRKLYALCEKWLGVPLSACVSEYGMTELSSQYYARAGKGFYGPAWLRVLPVDAATGRNCAPGRAGLLKHVDLANLGSVAAVQTEDIGRISGKGFELLGRASRAEARGCSLSYEKFLESSP